MYACMCVCVCIHTYVCTYIRVSLCVCVYVCVDAKQEGGHTLRAWLIESVEFQEQKVPQKGPTKSTLVIQSHGAGRDRRSWLRHTSFLRGAGYACLAFDFTDHGSFLLPLDYLLSYYIHSFYLLYYIRSFYLVYYLLTYHILYYCSYLLYFWWSLGTSDRADGYHHRRGTTLGLRESRDLARVGAKHVSTSQSSIETSLEIHATTTSNTQATHMQHTCNTQATSSPMRSIQSTIATIATMDSIAT